MSATLKKFFDSERGATFNLVMSQILWWALGAPVAFQYGYSDETESDGSYPSGNFGSGVFPVTLTIMLVTVLIFLYKMAHYFFFPTEEELDERQAQEDLEKRRSSHKAASMN